jgi:hypothetical protein
MFPAIMFPAIMFPAIMFPNPALPPQRTLNPAYNIDPELLDRFYTRLTWRAAPKWRRPLVQVVDDWAPQGGTRFEASGVEEVGV